MMTPGHGYHFPYHKFPYYGGFHAFPGYQLVNLELQSLDIPLKGLWCLYQQTTNYLTLATINDNSVQPVHRMDLALALCSTPWHSWNGCYNPFCPPLLSLCCPCFSYPCLGATLMSPALLQCCCSPHTLAVTINNCIAPSVPGFGTASTKRSILETQTFLRKRNQFSPGVHT